MSNRVAASGSNAPQQAESVALHTRARTQARHGQETSPPSVVPAADTAPRPHPNTADVRNPALNTVFVERDSRMERLENSLFLLASEFARDREERVMTLHDRAREGRPQNANSGGQRREQGQTLNANIEGGQDDDPDPSIRDIGRHRQAERRTARGLDQHGPQNLGADSQRVGIPQPARSVAGTGAESRRSALDRLGQGEEVTDSGDVRRSPPPRRTGSPGRLGPNADPRRHHNARWEIPRRQANPETGEP